MNAENASKKKKTFYFLTENFIVDNCNCNRNENEPPNEDVNAAVTTTIMEYENERETIKKQSVKFNFISFDLL